MALSKRAQEKLAADRAFLADNWIFMNRKTIISWANANGHEGLSFVNMADAYCHATTGSNIGHSANEFNAVAATYYQDPELTLADLLA